MFRLTTKQQQQQQQISHCGYCVVHILHHLPLVFFHSLHRLSVERMDWMEFATWSEIDKNNHREWYRCLETNFSKRFEAIPWKKRKNVRNLLNKHISIFMIHPSRFGYVFNLPWNIFRSKHFYRFVCISHSRFLCIFRCHHRLTTALVHFSLDFAVREENQKVIVSIEIRSLDINRKLMAAMDWSGWFFLND